MLHWIEWTNATARQSNLRSHGCQESDNSPVEYEYTIEYDVAEYTVMYAAKNAVGQLPQIAKAATKRAHLRIVPGQPRSVSGVVQFR